jgi:hypothetical protein
LDIGLGLTSTPSQATQIRVPDIQITSATMGIEKTGNVLKIDPKTILCLGKTELLFNGRTFVVTESTPILVDWGFEKTGQGLILSCTVKKEVSWLVELFLIFPQVNTPGGGVIGTLQEFLGQKLIGEKMLVSSPMGSVWVDNGLQSKPAKDEDGHKKRHRVKK